MISERNMYHDYKPSWLQKFVWFFWPTYTSIQLKRYRNVKVEDCVDSVSVNFDIEPPEFDKVEHVAIGEYEVVHVCRVDLIKKLKDSDKLLRDALEVIEVCHPGSPVHELIVEHLSEKIVGL
jgi:hypothetical protein